MPYACLGGCPVQRLDGRIGFVSAEGAGVCPGVGLVRVAAGELGDESGLYRARGVIAPRCGCAEAERRGGARSAWAMRVMGDLGVHRPVDMLAVLAH